MRALLFMLCALVASPASAIDDPSLNYHTITTPNFYVHYYDGIEDLAWRVAVISEEAHAIFSPLLEWKPAVRTHVNVTDKLDVANGSATAYGRNTMNIFGMPPESDSVLGFYDDWLRVLVYHEYVHILHLDTVGGISPYLNLLIGKQSNPNQSAPRWYIEGLATYHESSRTRGGRVSGATWQMWSRAAALDGTLSDLGAVTGFPTQWPGGNSAYLYGSLFFEYVFDRYGEDFGNEFNRIYGSRLIPWSLNSTAKSLTGETLEEMWNQFTAHATGKAMAERTRVVAEGETRVRSLTRRAGSHGFARDRPGGSVSFYHFDLESSPSYYEITPAGETRKLFTIFGGPGPASWAPDGDRFVYSQSNVIRSAYSYQDLYVWNARTESSYQMTKGERARDPSVSPDGKWVVYARNRNGTMELVVRELDRPSAGYKVLVSGYQHPAESDARWQQIAGPRFSPDSQKVVFSWWRLDTGQRDIWMVGLDGSELTQLTDDFALDMDPVFDGPNSVLYTSDRTGTFNIFQMNLDDQSVYQKTNVVTGVTGPLRDHRGRLWVTHYTSDGYDLGVVEEVHKPVTAPALQDKIAVIKYPEIDTSSFVTEPYSAVPWIAPLLFAPEFGLITTGTAFGGALGGYDPAGHHSWTLSTAITTGRELSERGINFAGQYSYNRLPFALSVLGRYRQYPQARGYFAASDFQTFMEDDYVLRAQTNFPFRGILENFSLSLSLQMQHVTFDDLPSVSPDPGDLMPTTPSEAWLNQASLGLSFVSVERYPRSISTEKGFSASLSLSLQNPFIGSDVQALTFSYSANGYLPIPFIPRHVLALNMTGGHVSSASGRTGQYTLGGALPQDVLTSIVFQEPAGGRVLRGYPPALVSGPNFQLWTLSYRFPIVELDQGFGTLPIFFRQIKGQFFGEAGTAYRGFIADADLIPSVGVELLLGSTFAYYLSGNLRLGYARGIGEGGIHDAYLIYGGGF